MNRPVAFRRLKSRIQEEELRKVNSFNKNEANPKNLDLHSSQTLTESRKPYSVIYKAARTTIKSTEIPSLYYWNTAVGALSFALLLCSNTWGRRPTHDRRNQYQAQANQLVHHRELVCLDQWRMGTDMQLSNSIWVSPIDFCICNTQT